jgi:hypothetical protein
MCRSGLLALGLIIIVVGGPLAADQPPAQSRISKELLQRRRDAAQKVYGQILTRLRAAEARPSELFGWSEKWLDADLALADKQTEQLKALKDHLARTREVERITTTYAKAGQGRQSDADAATYYRLDAEIRLRKAGDEVEPPKGEKGKPGEK